jgi:hypothetical protein
MGMMRRKYKGLLVVFLVLSGIMLLFSSLFPSSVMTSKWIMVAGQQKNVASSLYDLHKWQDWNDLLVGKTDITVEKKDSTLHINDKISWPSSNGSKSSIVVTSIQPDGISLDITNSSDLPIQSGFSLTQREDSVQVVWFIVEPLRWYPWEKIYGMMASDMKGPALQHSLDMFKEQVEQQ